jgi:hypothetical protein
MSNTMWTMLAALGGELLLVVVVLLAVAFVRSRAQHKRDLEAVRSLVAKIRKGKPEREQKIAAFLEQRMGLSGDALNQAKVAMLRAELGLLQRFAGVYRQRDAALAARFHDDLFAALEPYHALVASADAGADVSAAATADALVEPVEARELERLRKENARLSDELQITMETMSRMLNEYSSMFVGGEPDDAAPISAKIGGAAVAAAVAAAAAATADAQDIDDGIEIAGVVDEPMPANAADDDVEVAIVNASDLEVAELPEVDVAEDAAANAGVNDPADSIFDEVERHAGGEADAVADADMGNIEIAAADEDPAGDEPAAAVDGSAETELDTANGPGGEDDEIEAILEQAKSRETTARSDPAEDVARHAASNTPDAAGEVLAEAPGTLEEGEAEIVDFGDAEAVDDIDDLFDAASGDGSERPSDEAAIEQGSADADPAGDARAQAKSRTGG